MLKNQLFLAMLGRAVISIEGELITKAMGKPQIAVRLSPSLLSLGILLLLVLMGIGIFTGQPALAVITETESYPGELLCRSEQTLIDEKGNSWQLALFKQVYPEQTASLNLRVSGLSSSIRILHPQPLKLATAKGKVFEATDIFLEQAPLPSIGQYDLKKIFEQISNEELVLELPVAGESRLHLQVPSSVVKEWREVAAKIPARSADELPSNFQLAC
jgi:hypothetical protein